MILNFKVKCLIYNLTFLCHSIILPKVFYIEQSIYKVIYFQNNTQNYWHHLINLCWHKYFKSWIIWKKKLIIYLFLCHVCRQTHFEVLESIEDREECVTALLIMFLRWVKVLRIPHPAPKPWLFITNQNFELPDLTCLYLALIQRWRESWVA